MHPEPPYTCRYRRRHGRRRYGGKGILDAYSDLEIEDVREALRYAAEAVRERELPVVGGS